MTIFKLTSPLPREDAPLLTINLSAIEDNYRLLAARAAPAKTAVAVKANAYGLGIEEIAPVLASAGCRQFFVATAAEAFQLRALLPLAEIFLLNGPALEFGADLAGAGIAPVLNNLAQLTLWQAIARQRGERLPATLHLDTGLTRLGLTEKEVRHLRDHPRALDGLSIRLVMSHLACSDSAAHPMNLLQLERFRILTADLALPAPRSLAASSGIFLGQEYHFDLVRPGAAIYGLNPNLSHDNPMRPVIRLQARILQVQLIDRVGSVGYGATHPVEPGQRIATLAIGYADGYFRSLGGRAAVALNGHIAPVVGRVSMDLITVDVSGIPEELVRPGLFAEIIGPYLSADQLAQYSGTIGYEILTALGPRCRRQFIKDS